MHVAILTSSRSPYDDRIFFHQAISLSAHKIDVTIISSKSDEHKTEKNITFDCFIDKGMQKKQKINLFIKKLTAANPDAIIGSKPLVIYAAKKYNRITGKKAKIIYDITEWYPSKKYLRHINILSRPLAFFQQIIINLSAAAYSDAFIFGEYYKSLIIRKIFKQKKYCFVSYFPKTEYINFIEPRPLNKQLNLMYSGKLTKEKGFENFIEVVKKTADKQKDLQIKIKIIGWYANNYEKKFFEKKLKNLPDNVTFSEYPKQSFLDYLKLISDTDIFMDFRSTDFENQHCLPIKIFYFAAFKRPVIYSDLKAIRKEVKINEFGHLVNPKEYDKISDIIINYINNDKLYFEKCQNARQLFEKEYNWEKIEKNFIDFIKKMQD